ncbi:ribbon-helix-helix protein, CopG family [Pseudoblastomonas halimionae]|uniref:Ribbon-helix-helix protein, CopG family n=1 Tax=Alteriqipengyuania halimionae TaxID=1926630 RepID=A0A6I4U6J0_9SPHN|nr:ribbon-helix-helix protein, CopG family [Alteriqipengyuania halimionae]MXP09907.1 ribbon-helix-helix protein, CopG family [Alteriqipengyuania halimionae]
MRTLVEIPDDDIRWLDRRAEELGVSRTALVRDAVAQMRAGTSRRGVDQFFGLWRDRSDVGEGQRYQRRIRNGERG